MCCAVEHLRGFVESELRRVNSNPRPIRTWPIGVREASQEDHVIGDEEPNTTGSPQLVYDLPPRRYRNVSARFTVFSGMAVYDAQDGRPEPILQDHESNSDDSDSETDMDPYDEDEDDEDEDEDGEDGDEEEDEEDDDDAPVWQILIVDREFLLGAPGITPEDMDRRERAGIDCYYICDDGRVEIYVPWLLRETTNQCTELMLFYSREALSLHLATEPSDEHLLCFDDLVDHESFGAAPHLQPQFRHITVNDVRSMSRHRVQLWSTPASASSSRAASSASSATQVPLETAEPREPRDPEEEEDAAEEETVVYEVHTDERRDQLRAEMVHAQRLQTGYLRPRALDDLVPYADADAEEGEPILERDRRLLYRWITEEATSSMRDTVAEWLPVIFEVLGLDE